ncbi:alpha-glucan family phosphorylase [Cytophagaceae bacterium DM2B3-1]|uniref:Alpha-glucan family phosphorylase n=1 Tax=Xanthocytophaga flava TaxID=3048013 RepID=A0ABT7CPD8_9BACT|nr:alpha-glucan family phosphorylase [Xanthocytophaga flavus]MDJ1494855.1 alpha-glucan family phosphorylase [Xanthocytophaga flavus]
MATTFQDFLQSYQADPAYQNRTAYFCMEYAIHQSLKIYSGGLGFLAGSHMRSAYELKQNVIGIGILWKYGYYDQTRKGDQTMDVLFQEKVYGFLEKTDIKFSIQINHAPVWVTAYYLPPNVFGTVPVFLLSTDLPENDYLAQTTTHRLYDQNLEARIAASILLGIGGARLLEELHYQPDTYHLNESHGLPLAFYLYVKYNKDIEEVKKRLVFTNHTPEEAGNQKTDIYLLERMGFFSDLPLVEVRTLSDTHTNILDHTLAAFRLAGLSNGVSKMHTQVLQKMWGGASNISPILSITNAQNFTYWADKELYDAFQNKETDKFINRKKFFKRQLFEEVADQTGEIYNENVLTIVWSRRFAAYKRADLLLYDTDRFIQLLMNKKYPVQIIWAGKPYPTDYTGISVFNRLVHFTKKYYNCSVLVGYELKLSAMLKRGADVWLNTPRITHEASGTSGMTAAMNGALNCSTPDGWIPEFARNNENCFVLPPNDPTLPEHEIDEIDALNLYKLLEEVVIPMYYEAPDQWQRIVNASMTDILPNFDSGRMAKQYYELLYTQQNVLQDAPALSNNELVNLKV